MDPTAAFFQRVRHPLKFRLFLLQRLPAAFFAGLRLESADAQGAVVRMRYSWRNQNPFRSLYFASQAMAAEMSTGVLAMAHLYGVRPPVSMLVTGMEARFHKKATGTIRFVCKDGAAIGSAVQEARETGEARSCRALSTGYNEAGELVAEFWFTWSFKRKGGAKT